MFLVNLFKGSIYHNGRQHKVYLHVDDDARFAAARSCMHQQRAFHGLHRFLLFRIKAIQQAGAGQSEYLNISSQSDFFQRRHAEQELLHPGAFEGNDGFPVLAGGFDADHLPVAEFGVPDAVTGV